MAAHARDNQIADPAQSGKSLGPSAQRLAQARHLDDAPRHQGGLRVVAHAHAVQHARGHRQHILQRSAELRADHVVRGVNAEEFIHARLLDRAGGRRVL